MGGIDSEQIKFALNSELFLKNDIENKEIFENCPKFDLEVEYNGIYDKEKGYWSIKDKNFTKDNPVLMHLKKIKDVLND